MRKLRHWGDSSLAQYHTASKWQRYKYSFNISLCPQVCLCMSYICSERGQLLKFPPTCPALIGSILNYSFWGNRDFLFFLFFVIFMDPAASPELLCTAQWTLPLFLCCIELSLPIFIINDSVKGSWGNDAVFTMYCSFLIFHFAFFCLRSNHACRDYTGNGFNQQLPYFTQSASHLDWLRIWCWLRVIMSSLLRLYSPLVYKTCLHIAGTQVHIV